MAKKKIDFDFKKFMLEKGERVGLAVAGGFAVLLIALGVMVGLGKSSPLKALQDNTKKLKQEIAVANPGDIPPPPPKPDFEQGIDPENFSMFEWLPRFNMEDNKRRNPPVLSLVDSKVNVVRAPMLVMDYDPEGKRLQTVSGDTPAQMIRPTHMVVVTGAFPYRKQLEAYLNALKLKSANKLAADEWPTFAGFRVYRRVTDPTGKVISGTGKDDQFEILDLDGSLKGATLGSTKITDSSFKKLLSVAARVDPPDEKLAPLAFRGLVMPLPALDDLASYPVVRLKGLPEIRPPKKDKDQETVPNPAGPIKPSYPLRPKGSSGSAAGPAPGPMGGDAAPEERLVTKDLADLPKELQDRLNGTTVNVFDPTQSQTAADQKEGEGASARPEKIPDNCLFRFVDVDVKPGYTYDYLIAIRLKNPNHGKFKLVASRKYASDEFAYLYSDFTPVLQVKVPFDIEFYAVDERALDPGNYLKAAMTGAVTQWATQEAPLYKTNVAVQIHRWVDYAEASGGLNRKGLGAWLVAERLLLHRGEVIGGKVKVDFPRWNESTNQFVLNKSSGKKKDQGTPVDFTAQPVDRSLPPAVLLDFQGGKRQSVTLMRPDGRPETRYDDSAVEMLVLTSEGKLAVRNGRTDSDWHTTIGKKRKDRYLAWWDWIQQLKGLKTSGGAGGSNLD